MKISKIKNNHITAPETFLVWSNEIGNRLDPFFYRPIFKKLVATINSTTHKAFSLGNIIEFSFAGDWGEDPISFEPNHDYQLCYVLRNTNFDNKYNLNFNDVAQRYVKNSKVEKLALQKGDILIEKSGGSPIQPVGRVAFVEDLPFDKPVIFSNFLQKIRIAGDSFFPEYVFTFLQAIYHLGYTEFLQNQTTGIKNLRLDDFFKIKIAELPKNEQKKIAKFAFDTRKNAKEMEEKAIKILSSIDDFVLGELDRYAAGGGVERVFQIWSDEIHTRLDPSYFRPIFKMLDKIFSTTKYNVKTLKNLSTKITSGATPLSGGDAYTDQSNGIPFLRSGDINPDNEIDFDNLNFIKQEIHSKKLRGSQLKKGDLLIALIGATIGQVSIYSSDKEANISQNLASVRFNEEVVPDYAKEFLLSKIGQMQLERVKRYAARANINLDEVGSLQVIYPSKDKQNEMVGKIRKIRAKATELRQEAESIVAGAQREVEQMILA